ncbi:3'(2'),5'-bisphosphate nucleotidase CysQ [Candidatus Purcelliella pentastirinorum]|uniref:3'(2'),5'-bisphosphate nucleotidase CysQ n=1 Tax=Candidatus Purcelliella pentastirinorum TaxID=472834 RepID=A0AAX3N9F5_9ENTR|nr:3'(2'),5'-bisphosphate nucleotidase CysQ [Candidatus Purcelliella pentastirinorum]WDI78742.1 3'(2'),5'-bisphosphate nucleotidase CysQ [Candidatus Purcelliella pentastirinorum]WDR80740.1 3'(2'),5'-bisphosphate nucleotidase CysQ [Candidatus Purcelliella pentastirinorum]
MLNKICNIVKIAGDAVMEVYHGNFFLYIKHKQDCSPITIADYISNDIIINELSLYTPNIPFLSEEYLFSWNERKNWRNYWLIDPMDGTKEFLNRNGEFTINIALINEFGLPILGVIYAPAINIMYYAYENKAWKEDYNGHKERINIFNLHPPTVVISRSHYDSKIKDYLNILGEHNLILSGSSLKFCLIAEGLAQYYPRFNATSVWDIAAGHAILLAAGAYLYDWNGNSINYIPRKSFINPGFLVSLKCHI